MNSFIAAYEINGNSLCERISGVTPFCSRAGDCDSFVMASIHVMKSRILKTCVVLLGLLVTVPVTVPAVAAPKPQKAKVTRRVCFTTEGSKVSVLAKSCVAIGLLATSPRTAVSVSPAAPVDATPVPIQSVKLCYDPQTGAQYGWSGSGPCIDTPKPLVPLDGQVFPSQDQVCRMPDGTVVNVGTSSWCVWDPKYSQKVTTSAVTTSTINKSNSKECILAKTAYDAEAARQTAIRNRVGDPQTNGRFETLEELEVLFGNGPQKLSLLADKQSRACSG
jgi:hypothetical protein